MLKFFKFASVLWQELLMDYN